MTFCGEYMGIILAVVFGTVIGIEREISGKAAGIRTNALICIGAAVFTIISRHIAGAENDSATRIAAQVVTGVGFLGAGAIIRDRGGIQGLTSAATIWIVAAIGMACGAKMYLVAAMATVIAIVVLISFERLDRYVKQRLQKRADKAISEEDSGEPVT